jgi:hypothetical protein
LTPRSEVQYVVDARLLDAPPTVGSYVASPSGQTVLLLTRIARVVASKAKGEQFRLYAMRLRRAALPPYVAVIPWPREKRGVGRPSQAAMPPAPSDRPAIVTRQQKQTAERKRITAHRRTMQAPEHHLAEPVRLANKTLESAEFRDPDDTNPNRRVPKTVKSFRNCSSIDYLVRSGTITRAHGRAANLFRNQYEKSAGLGLGQSDLGAPRITSGSPPVGISEMQLFAIDSVRQVKKLLNGLYPLVLAVAVDDITLKDFARRSHTNPSMVAGKLMGALEVLSGHYSPPEPPTAERATINTGQYGAPPK